MKRILMTGVVLALSSGIALAQTATNGPAAYNDNPAQPSDYRAGATQHSSAMSFSQPSYANRLDQVRAPRISVQPRTDGDHGPSDQMMYGSSEGGNN